MRRSFVLALPLLLALASCGSEKTDNQQVAAENAEATATATPALVGPGDKAVELPLTAQAFVDAASAGDMYEMESARIVQATGPGQPLTDLTQMMLRDHQASSEALKEAANAGSAGVFPDAQKLTAEQKAKLDALREAGANLGKLYLNQQVVAHEKALAILKNYAASGDNQTLMAYARKTIPVISHHLDVVKKLASGLQISGAQ